MQTEDKIQQFFKEKFPFNQEGLQEFSDSFVSKSYHKGKMIIQANSVVHNLIFLDEGVIREYFAKDDREMNTNFYTRPQFVNDFFTFTNAIPTKRNLECLSDVKTREMSMSKFNEFMMKYSCGKSFVDDIFNELIEIKEEEEFKHFSLTPDELYLDLMKNKPEWFQEIPLYHIASYLRMTPETLSRIRKRV
ncbi:Crp/Fnr family transcriptional regulator [Aureibacter tunicatorum]|uniref:CRP-like cAMP-binding protein n=1 Tax=Aureibacter tunicatorum TaxID=866807 RepID=A0AAE3XST4_9BACT|nr:cyclic nucleotide-binding domain-containing protein [Aureibacter tunicatorum]MDR6241448.1 CRP-like cAMP-binding protein [Aureibacter tunicatorum]BDD06707.1 cyclic nucleotide-binding protein [Aureibacter tunicatorum]